MSVKTAARNRNLLQRIPAELASSDNKWVRQGYRLALRLARRVVNRVTGRQLGWVGVLTAVRWVGKSQLEICGWAYERGMCFSKPSEVEVWLKTAGAPPISGKVTYQNEPIANTKLMAATQDYSLTGFSAVVDVSAALKRGARSWQVIVKARDDSYAAKGSFQRVLELTSALYPQTRDFAGQQVIPTWSKSQGLVLDVVTPVVGVASVAIDQRELELELVSKLPLTKIYLQAGPAIQELQLTKRDGRLIVTGAIPEISDENILVGEDDFGFDAGQKSLLDGELLPMAVHKVIAVTQDGKKYPIRISDNQLPELPTALPFAFATPVGELRLLDTAAFAIITDEEVVEAPELGVKTAGVLLGNTDQVQFWLAGGRAKRAMQIDVKQGSFTGFASWLASEWGRSPRPPLPGKYSIEAKTPNGRIFVMAGSGLTARAHTMFWGTEVKCRCGISKGRRVTYRMSKPTKADEMGIFQQRRIQSIYHSKTAPLGDHFFFDSFNGRQATDNPYGLDRDLAKRFPELPRYWGVSDASVAVPDGAVAVIDGTQAWWKARQTARYVVANEWLLTRFKHQPGQVVLQTWHGTMLKTIGLDRPDTNFLIRKDVLKETKNWDFLLSQNPHSSKVFSSAYAWEGELWEEGYPRNDAIFTQSGAPIRKLLGIPDDKKVILYAPTWRENQDDMVAYLDPAPLMAELGPDFVLLIRGHARTMRFGQNVQLPGVIDVTTYPNITDLFLVADALITDYSSVMFDYSNTTRPMIFFVPDMDEYRDTARGVYFDLSEIAPGPVLATQDEVTHALLSLETDVPKYQDKYTAWRERFNPWDGADCAQRINDRLLAAGG